MNFLGNSGLGIGTSATGLIKHGISTTIVELDPAVYQYAKEYFDLPLNHTAHITNAIDYVRKEEQNQTNGQEIKKYDYILHDVFTGGAVPAALFTSEFLNSTRSLLKKEGVIAIVRPFFHRCIGSIFADMCDRIMLAISIYPPRNLLSGQFSPSLLIAELSGTYQKKVVIKLTL